MILLAALVTAAAAVGGLGAAVMPMPFVPPSLALVLGRYDGVPLLDHRIA